MPTPSSSTPDSHSPQSFPLGTTCPDPEEHQNLASAPPTIPRPPLQTPSWRHFAPHPSLARYVATDPLPLDQDMTNSAGAPRSDAMAPHPQQDAHDVEMVQEQEFDEVVTARSVADESRKQHEIEDDDQSGAGNDTRRVGSSRTTSGGAKQDATGATGTSPGRESLSNRWRQLLDRQSPVPGEVHDVDLWGSVGKGPRWVEDSGLVGLGNEYGHKRSIPTTSSSYLRPGSKFEGTQQSERQRYDVEVEIKHVDLSESFLCGYLKIQGLTDDHPTLTTYFEGEIIGSKHGFITQHPSWGATEKIDYSHWAKFTAFRPYAKQSRKGGQIMVKDMAQRENIFMRWKEHFLVPDHRVRTINGASFEGFYYICFNQVKGEVSGIYFHSKSEKFQQLDLKHVRNKGCYGAMEFR
ncbi:glucose-induced degradation protein 4 [Cladorrhinum samala]|uniref:Glucose-induced degradation protein 4 n=1 Tax=Cladorrhinum samala TaxID=585594 RepID=A0AAV9HYZ1_9PEZI|nr:glucose-induced degradation protein 4 [Cladorrhinum samala]